MPLTIKPNIFITCAITGSGSTQDRSSNVPRSPKQIADVPFRESVNPNKREVQKAKGLDYAD